MLITWAGVGLTPPKYKLKKKLARDILPLSPPVPIPCLSRAYPML